MKKEDYFEYMNSPLSDFEKQQLIDRGWAFASEEYMYIPDDYDGCMASGIHSIRKILLHYKYPELYNKYSGRCKDVLEAVSGNYELDE